VKREKLLALAFVTIVLIFLLRSLLFSADIQAERDFFDIDTETQRVLTPYYEVFSDGLDMEAIVIASEYDDDTLVEDTFFSPGSTLYFIMSNVTGITVQEDGYSWYDVDLIITFEDGSTIVEVNKNLGDIGQGTLYSDIISPYGIIAIPAEVEPGVYTISVTFYDLYSEESVSKSAEFSIVEA
jgi:hypothetical protein